MKSVTGKKSKSGKPANYSLIIPPGILERLESLAKATNRSKVFYIREALQRLNDRNAKNISTEELRERLGL